MFCALAIMVASPERIRRWTPALVALVTGPGTAITGRPRVRLDCAVLNASLRAATSTMTVPRSLRRMSRFRVRRTNRTSREG